MNVAVGEKLSHRTKKHLVAVQNSGVERKFLRVADVQAMTGLSRGSIYKFQRQGTFPAAVQLAPKTSAWLHSEVVRWCEERIAQQRCQPKAA